MSEDNNPTQELDDDEEVVLERIIPEEEDDTPAPDRFDRVQPFYDRLKVDKVTLKMDEVKSNFNRHWQYEEGDSLPEDEQFLLSIGLFIYTAHIALDDFNIHTVKARGFISKALTEWKQAEIDQQVAEEKATDNPFKTFVDKEAQRMEKLYDWKNFQMETKKSGEEIWDFKMKRCWFHSFFVRYGRVDYIESACEFDRIPWKAREDYVSLKLSNTFSKLGQFCQFKYTPPK